MARLLRLLSDPTCAHQPGSVDPPRITLVSLAAVAERTPASANCAVATYRSSMQRFRSSSARLSGKFPQVAGVKRYLEDIDAAGGQLKRVLDRLGEQGAYRNGSGFTHPLDAQLVVGGGRDVVKDFDRRHFRRGW